jgi:hypothetical protein
MTIAVEKPELGTDLFIISFFLLSMEFQFFLYKCISLKVLLKYDIVVVLTFVSVV